MSLPRFQPLAVVHAHRSGSRWLSFCLAGVLAGLWFPAVAVTAQGADKPAPKAEAPKKASDLKPVELGGNDLVTDDGVQLKATFYPSPKGSEAVPIVLLHSYKGDRKEFTSALAPFLQQQGHAVLAPDLRFHGESIRALTSKKPLDAAKMAPDQFEQMLYQDMKVLKRFLVAKHKAGELNLSKLCLVGAEMGALVALNSAWLDWSTTIGEAPPRDVKALVLISPPASFRSLDTKAALRNPAVCSRLSTLILVGKGKDKELEEANRLYSILKRERDRDPERRELSEKEMAEKQDLFFLKLDTKLQGAKMLRARGLNLEKLISQFIEIRLVKHDQPDYHLRPPPKKGL